MKYTFNNLFVYSAVLFLFPLLASCGINENNKTVSTAVATIETSTENLSFSDLSSSAQELCNRIVGDYNLSLENIPDFQFVSVLYDNQSTSYDIQYENTSSVSFKIILDKDYQVSGISVEGLNLDPDNQYNYCLVATYIPEFNIGDINQDLAMLIASPESDYQTWDNDTTSVTIMSKDGIPFYFGIFLK